MKKLRLTIVVMFITAITSAQNIGSLELFPSNPTTDDSLKVICYGSFTSSCTFLSSNINIVGNVINIQVFYEVDSQPVICPIVDTISIGKLDTGAYELVYNLIDSTHSFYDTDTLYFDILFTGISELLSLRYISVNIYPNPVKNNLSIEFEINGRADALCSIYDYTGKEIESFEFKQLPKGNHRQQINTAQFPPGIYMIVANINGQLRSMKFVKMFL